MSKANEAAKPDASEVREMLRAMQAGELTVSRGVELVDMWLAGNYSDDLLPTVRQDLIEEDSTPVEIIDRLKAELADRASPGMVSNLKATIRQLTDELAEANASQTKLREALTKTNDALERFLCPAPAAQAAPDKFEPLPPGVVMHHQLGQLFDSFQMQQYAMRHMLAAAPQPSTPVSLTGNSTPESFALPEWMPKLYSWLARAKFDNAGDEATAALYGNHLRDLIVAGQRPTPPSKTAKGKEQWFCLLCGSGREGYHRTLDDGVTPCPNGQQKGGAQ